MNVVRTELFALRHRPGARILIAVWCMQTAVFGYAVSYLIYRHQPKLTAAQRTQIHSGLLPSALGRQALYAMPLYGGPVMLLIGALVAAGDYRWGTLRTILARRPQRTDILLGRCGALATVMLAVAVLTMLVGGVCSAVIGALDGDPLRWPSIVSLITDLLALWLVCCSWSALGFILGVATRSSTVAISVGLIWTLVVENIVSGLSTAVPILHWLRKGLLSSITGSLAKALGDGSSAPGVSSVVSGQTAVAELFAFIGLGMALSLWLFRRRDVR